MTPRELPDQLGLLPGGSDASRPAAGDAVNPAAGSLPTRRARREAQIARKVRTPLRSRLSAVGVMAVVAGLFAPLALPAFAQTESDGSAPIAARSAGNAAQTFNVAQDVATSDLARDTYTATSAASLAKLHRDAVRQRNLSLYASSGARALGDDYPWYGELSRNQGGGLSPLRYYYRECVDFVAWRLNRDKGHTSGDLPINWSTLGAGSAFSWRSAWESHGWDTGPDPVPGAVAYFPGQNHVAYVNSVLSDGTVLLEEYNYGTDHLYDQRIISPGAAYYLYPPPIG